MLVSQNIHLTHTTVIVGIANVNAQGNGMQAGGGTTGKWYNNFIKNGPGNGIIILGIGNIIAFNNVIIDPGTYGIFVQNTASTIRGSYNRLLSNTVIRPGKEGFRIYSEVTTNSVLNNVVAGAGGNLIAYAEGATADVRNNVYNKTMDYFRFTNPAASDYTVQSGSPAIDAGVDLSSFGEMIQSLLLVPN
jgi:hypothetical protein